MKQLKSKLALAIALGIVATGAMAGGDTTFDTAVATLTDWMEGSLGVMLSIAFVAVGIVGGIARQSLIAFAVGIGGALGISIAPGILAGVFTAGLPLL